MEVLLHDEQGRFALELAKGVDHCLDDGGGEALAWLIDEEQLARLDDGARDGEHLLLPAGKHAGRAVPEFLDGREETEDPLQPLFVQGAGARREEHVLVHGKAGEDAHVLGHVGDAHARELGGRRARDVLRVEADAAGGGAPQAHDGAKAGGLARTVASEEHREGVSRNLKVHALKDVVLADVRVDAGELEQFSHGPPRDTLPARSAGR